MLWRSPVNTPILCNNEVHVWRANLDQAAQQRQDWLGLLTPDERERATRYFFARDRDGFIAGRGILRSLLGRYLETEPSSLRFAYNSYGKPALAMDVRRNRLRFNVSHSAGLVLFAFSLDQEVGVDVEKIRTEISEELITELLFSKREIATLRAHPLDTRVRAFFKLWTFKEAYIKARGEGLSLPLNQFEVLLTLGSPVIEQNVQREKKEDYHWTIRELALNADFAGAVAVEGNDWQLRCWQWRNGG
jgi:4'-phosphopantetheinyl transferase